ncbi:hypothetical protein NM208_g8174 [Fusarium decemcellulare]|uniref:Uncharacterized protein n=1 Tax=Fusarium decemcellulare TaxID=57161 RepID=A0ACC1S6F8_9HYPO|nr:hypothetical protein NM208_g8174 [Fusarium decemcellulare]
MTTIAGSLQAALPKPRYTGEDEEAPARAQQRGVRVVGPGQLDETQLVLKRSGPPPYRRRTLLCRRHVGSLIFLRRKNEYTAEQRERDVHKQDGHDVNWCIPAPAERVQHI